MSIKPLLPSSTVYNPNLFSSNDYLTVEDGDSRYTKIGGDVYATTVNCDQLYIGGSLVDLTYITGLTPGIASASKALVVDSNRSITNVNALSATSLTSNTLNLNGSINLGGSVNTTCNGSIVFTGQAGSPTTTNGIGLGFSPLLNGGEGRLKCFNYVMSSMNHINVNEGTIYCKSDKTVGINTTSPAVQFHVNGVSRITSYLQVGTSTDTTRMISCLDSTMTNGTSRVITVGKLNSSLNQGEISWTHNGDGANSNYMSLGAHSLPVVYIRTNGGVGLSNSNPQYKLDVFGNANFTEEIRQDGTEVINTSGVWTSPAGVDTTGRITCRHSLGFNSFGSFGSEMIMNVSGSGAFFGSYSNHPCRIGTGNTTRLYFDSNGTSACFHGTLNQYPLAIDTNTGATAPFTGSVRYYNDSGNIGVSSNPPTISLYCNGRALIRGELDVICDRRIKENIYKLDDEMCERFIHEINPVRFNYKSEQAVSFGYIAQDIAKKGEIFKDLITLHDDDKMEEFTDNEGYVSPKGLRFGIITASIVPILHKHILKLDKEVSTQGSIIDSLIRVIDRMEERLNRLSSI